MSHSLPFNNTNFKTQSHSSARFPLRVREVHSNQFLECCSCINLLKQWMILFTCDLQASQKQWKASSFWMKHKNYPTEHILLSHKVILFKTLVLCFLLLVSFGFCFPLGIVFFIPLHVFPLKRYHFHRWVRSTWIPHLFSFQSQELFWAMPWGTVCLTNMQQPFEAGQRHVGNYHALAGNECNYLGNINSAAQDSFPDSVVSPCAPRRRGGSQACTMALLAAKITYK